MNFAPTRRDLLKAGVALGAAGLSTVAAADARVPVIDTHTHFYDPTRPGGVPWPGKDDKVLYRAVLPGEYKRLAAPHGVTGTVVVEASPWVEDNQWLLDLAKDEPFLVGVVGRLLPDDADFTRHLSRFAKNPLFRGIRIPSGEVRNALANDAQLGRLKALGDAGLTLDVNGGPEVLALTARLADRLPKLRIVVNHMGNVPIDGKEPPAGWAKDVKALSGAANVWCKLSAFVEASRKREQKAPKDLAFYRPVLDVVWSAFGVDKLMFGSDWPVSDNFASFATVYNLASSFVNEKGKGAFAKAFGANAKAAYRLTRG